MFTNRVSLGCSQDVCKVHCRPYSVGFRYGGNNRLCVEFIPRVSLLGCPFYVLLGCLKVFLYSFTAVSLPYIVHLIPSHITSLKKLLNVLALEALFSLQFG